MPLQWQCRHRGCIGITCDGEDNLSKQESDSNAFEDDLGGEDHELGGKEHNSSGSYKVSEEGGAFLETVFTSKLKYQTRQAKVEKYGMPDSKWVKWPELSPIVAAILPKESVKQDKVAFR